MRPRSLAAFSLFAWLTLSCGSSYSNAAPACSGSTDVAATVDYGPPFTGGFAGGWYDVGDAWTGVGDDTSDDDSTGQGGDESGDGAESGDDTGGDPGGDDTGGGTGDDSSGDDSGGESARIRPTDSPVNDASCASCAIACTTTAGDGSTQAYAATGRSSIGYEDACVTAQSALLHWAHRHVGSRVTACRRLDSTETATPYRPAAPTVRTSHSRIPRRG